MGFNLIIEALEKWDFMELNFLITLESKTKDLLEKRNKSINAPISSDLERFYSFYSHYQLLQLLNVVQNEFLVKHLFAYFSLYYYHKEGVSPNKRILFFRE